MSKLVFFILVTIVIAATASGWVYAFTRNGAGIPEKEALQLQASFNQQYGTDNTIQEAIIPKIYEVAWTDKQGNKFVSANFGGIWVTLSTTPAAAAP